MLVNGLPAYQNDGKQCVNGITKDGLIFKSEQCGITFSHSNWQQKQVIKIFGQIDQLVNVKDRIVFLRLYNDEGLVSPNEPIWYWKNIHLPDIKVCIFPVHIHVYNMSIT